MEEQDNPELNAIGEEEKTTTDVNPPEEREPEEASNEAQEKTEMEVEPQKEGESMVIEETKAEGETEATESKEESEKPESSPKTKRKSKKEAKREKKDKILQQLSLSIFGGSDDEAEAEAKDESENAEDSEGKKRKRDSKKRKDKEGKKRSKKQIQNEDELAPESEESQKEISDFDEIIAKMKNSRRRKKTDKSEMEVEQMVEAFILRMDIASQEDIEANREKAPAFSKLKMLPDVVKQLRKKNLKELFIENEIMHALDKWLKPLPDKSLPNIKVRQTILELLNEFGEIPIESLKGSGIGKSVMILYKHPEESIQNKRTAKILIERWSRPIFGISEKYKDLETVEHEAVVKKKNQKRSQPNSATIDLELELDKKIKASKKEDSPGVASFHARIPDRISFDFKVRPKSQVSESGTRKEKAVHKKIDSVLTKRYSGTPVKSSRASSLSIEGRNML